MIHFFTPYSFQKKLFEAWDSYMNLVQDPNDWVCMMDGDVLFLLADFGHQMQEYIDKFPDTGLFTCYASRAHRQEFIRKGVDMENPSILYHYDHAENCRKTLHLQVKELAKPCLGHLMLMKKATWLLIRDKVGQTTANCKILGVDVRISKAVSELGMPVLLMRGIYVLHFFRMKNGINERSILL
jgi:hypothetical protein